MKGSIKVGIPQWAPGVGIIPQPNSLFVYSLGRRLFDVFNLGSAVHLEGIDGTKDVSAITHALSRRFPQVPVADLSRDVTKLVTYLGARGYVEDAPDSHGRPAPFELLDSADRVKAVHADIELTRNCNLSCSYCYASAGTKFDDLPAETWLEKLNDMHRAGLRAVVVSGGGPTLHPGFREIFTFCCEKFITTLNTNGARINDDWATWMSSLQLQVVQISLDSDRPAEHDAQRGRGAWKAAVSGITNLRRHDVPVRISCVVHEGNVHRISHLRDFADSVGAAVVFDIMKPVGRARTKEETDFLRSSLAVVQANPVPEVYKMLQAMEIRCQALLGFVGISADAHVKPCNLTRDFFDALDADVFEDIRADFDYASTNTFRNTKDACDSTVAEPRTEDFNPLDASCVFATRRLLPLRIAGGAASACACGE